MQYRIYAILCLSNLRQVKTPLLCRAAGTPGNTDCYRVQSRHTRYAREEVCKPLIDIYLSPKYNAVWNAESIAYLVCPRREEFESEEWVRRIIRRNFF